MRPRENKITDWLGPRKQPTPRPSTIRGASTQYQLIFFLSGQEYRDGNLFNIFEDWSYAEGYRKQRGANKRIKGGVEKRRKSRDQLPPSIAPWDVSYFYFPQLFFFYFFSRNSRLVVLRDFPLASAFRSLLMLWNVCLGYSTKVQTPFCLSSSSEAIGNRICEIHLTSCLPFSPEKLPTPVCNVRGVNSILGIHDADGLVRVPFFVELLRISIQGHHFYSILKTLEAAFVW